MNRSRANTLAGAMIAFYAVIGALVIYFYRLDWSLSAPIVIYYFLILVNTQLSVSFFLSIIPKHSHAQIFINAALLLVYLGLALTLNNPLNFMLMSTLLFALSTIKYVLLVEENDHKLILWRKILVQTFGTVACVLTVFGILSGYAFWATSLWTLCFIIANVYLVSIKPLYELENEN